MDWFAFLLFIHELSECGSDKYSCFSSSSYCIEVLNIIMIATGLHSNMASELSQFSFSPMKEEGRRRRKIRRSQEKRKEMLLKFHQKLVEAGSCSNRQLRNDINNHLVMRELGALSGLLPDQMPP